MSEDYAGLGRSTRVEGGGMLQDLDAEVVDIQWGEMKYVQKSGSTVGKPALGLRVTFRAIGDTKIQKPIEEQYSAGDLKFFKPSKDGAHIVRVPGHGRTGLAKDCHAVLFLDYAAQADPSLEDWPQGVTVLKGRRVHLSRKPFPVQSKKDNTKLAITGFLNGAVGGGTGSTGGGEDVAAETEQAIIGALEKAGEKGLTKAKLSKALFDALEGNPNRRAITEKALDNTFIEAGAKKDLWNFDGKTLTPAE